MGGPQIRLCASTGASCRREIIAHHGHILQDITGTRNRGDQRLQRIIDRQRRLMRY
jgi:hypothetical protein